jgi:signal transduction histidine kinase
MAMRSTSLKDQAGPGVPKQATQSSTSARGGAESDGPRPQTFERGRDPLLAAICHDLRAPLAAVTMGANFVLSTVPEDETAGRSRRVLKAVLRSCKQMERLVRDFADLSEIESGAVVLRPSEQDAREMLAIAAENARVSGAARNVSIFVARPDNPIQMRCDRDRLLRALAHVLDNAVRFSPEGGKVELAVIEHGGQVSFTITDNGPGLNPDTLDHLYDRTWLAKRPDRTGSGLGLAIVRGIVEAHRGRVEVDTKPGATTFSLVLPKELT